MPDHPSVDVTDTSRLPASARLRSGTAARLAGLPVTTLRVWERRYQVVAAPKTATGQRLYSPLDVQRLALLKQLTDRGHAIGTIAGLLLAELQGLSASSPALPALAAPGPALRLAVVGRAVAQKLAAAGTVPWVVYDDLEAAEAQMQTPAPGAAEVLLAHLPLLHPAQAERALRLAAQQQVGTLLVVYAFGSEAVAESLRAAGALVRREPCSGRELLRLLASARTPAATATATGLQPPTARRFSEETLASLAEQASSVACECPRHLAELVLQLSQFERYSAECDVHSPADAALHRHLAGLAGAARAMFEQALQRVVVDEGLSVA